MTSPPPVSPTRANLRRLCAIRAMVLAGLSAGLLLLARVDGPDSTFWPLTGTLTLFGIGTLLSCWRSYWVLPIAEAEFFAHLLFDLVIFTAVLYLSGGATNPLVSYYLVPIAIAAATLPRRLTWAITLLSLAAYTLLMQVYVPLEPLSPHTTHHQEPHTWFDLHILGMWLNFAVSAGFITYFVVRMVEAVRERDARIQRHLDEERRIEQVLSIASLAAGTAHELGTPLNSIQILADELHEQLDDHEELRPQLTSLRHAVDQCRNTLRKLVATAETGTGNEWRHVVLKPHLQQVLELWRLTRPRTEFHIELEGPAEAQVQLHVSVDQTLANLINNAVDASPERVDIAARWEARQLRLTIRDFGSGLDTAVLEQVGNAVLTTKRHGLGIGLLLSKANLERLGGTITLSNAPDGGTCAEVILPLIASNYRDGKETHTDH